MLALDSQSILLGRELRLTGSGIEGCDSRVELRTLCVRTVDVHRYTSFVRERLLGDFAIHALRCLSCFLTHAVGQIDVRPHGQAGGTCAGWAGAVGVPSDDPLRPKTLREALGALGCLRRHRVAGTRRDGRCVSWGGDGYPGPPGDIRRR